MPIRLPRGNDALDASGRKITASPLLKTVTTTFDNVFGNVWAPSSDVHFHKIEVVDGSSSYVVGLVAGLSLASFAAGTLFGSDPSREISVRVVAHALLDLDTIPDLDGNRRGKLAGLLELDTLNRESLRVVVNRRLGEETLFALWAPLDSKGEGIDWEAIQWPL